MASNLPKFLRNWYRSHHRVSHYHQMSEAEFLMSDAYQQITTTNWTHRSFVLNELRICPGFSSKQIEDHLKEHYGDVLKEVCSKTVYNYVMYIR